KVPLALFKHCRSKRLDVLSVWQWTIEISLMCTFQSWLSPSTLNDYCSRCVLSRILCVSNRKKINSRGANKVSHYILYCTHTAMEIVTVIVAVIAKQKQKICTAQYTDRKSTRLNSS